MQERDFRRGVCRQGKGGRRLFGEDLAEVIMSLAEGPDVGEVRAVTQCSSHVTVYQQILGGKMLVRTEGRIPGQQ